MLFKAKPIEKQLTEQQKEELGIGNLGTHIERAKAAIQALNETEKRESPEFIAVQITDWYRRLIGVDVLPYRRQLEEHITAIILQDRA